jgi:DNA polymerase III subunit beta
MKFIIRREELLRPLQLVAGAVERKQTLPILSNVMLSIRGQQLSIVATDLEVELIARLVIERNDNNAEDFEEITVSAKKLIDICRSLADEAQIEISTKGDRLILNSGKGHFSLATLSANEFPNVGNAEDDKTNNITFSLPQNKLKKLLESINFSMANQDVRYFLNGMLFELNQGVIKAVATDGHRLSMSSIAGLVDNKEKASSVIVPRKGILELMRLLEDLDSEIKIILGSNHIRVSTQEFTFTSKLIEGQFPSYSRVIPKGGDKIVVIDREQLKHVLIRVSILSNEKFRGIRLHLASKAIKLFANNPDQEEAEEELTVDYKGADLEIAFNVSYLIDICNAISSEKIKLIFSDSNSSILIEPYTEETGVVDNFDCLYVLMPMRL